MKVKCPRCKQETEYEVTNKHRPFCSERCQMIDLGQWAEGRYAIPVTDPNELDEEHREAAESLSTSGDPDQNIH